MQRSTIMSEDTKEKYINPYTDFGFKKLFGTEMNKDLLISFLNALFSGSANEIEDVRYLNGENLGDGYGDRRSVFDVYCSASDGSRFIVEMQKAEQTYFKDRSVYYATTPIRQQAPKGKWDYHLENVYTVGILNFEFPNNEYPANSYRHEIKLKDVEDNHVFYDKLTFFYLEMPKFNKTEDELAAGQGEKDGIQALKDEALRVVKSLPEKWKPATQDGVPVRCRFNIPVVFRLQ